MSNTTAKYPVAGAGIGLRRSLLNEFIAQETIPVGFMEVAPENWIGLGGRFGKQFRHLTERYPFTLHGLSAFVELDSSQQVSHQIGLAIQNLTDELYAEFTNISQFRPQPKRNFVLTYRLRFR